MDRQAILDELNEEKKILEQSFSTAANAYERWNLRIQIEMVDRNIEFAKSAKSEDLPPETNGDDFFETE